MWPQRRHTYPNVNSTRDCSLHGLPIATVRGSIKRGFARGSGCGCKRFVADSQQPPQGARQRTRATRQRRHTHLRCTLLRQRPCQSSERASGPLAARAVCQLAQRAHRFNSLLSTANRSGVRRSVRSRRLRANQLDPLRRRRRRGCYSSRSRSRSRGGGSSQMRYDTSRRYETTMFTWNTMHARTSALTATRVSNLATSSSNMFVALAVQRETARCDSNVRVRLVRISLHLSLTGAEQRLCLVVCGAVARASTRPRRCRLRASERASATRKL